MMDDFLKCPYCLSRNIPVVKPSCSSRDTWDVCDSCGKAFTYDVEVICEYMSYKDKCNEED